MNLLLHSPNIRFAGEAAADAGGRLREFFTLAMHRFSQLPSMTFGTDHSVCFISDTDSVLSKKYFLVGQVCGVCILTLGRGPECIHPAVVRALFKIDQPKEIEGVNDASINQQISKIESGNYDPLYDLNISTFDKTAAEYKRLFLISALAHSKNSNIEQFRDGLISISNDLVSENAFNVMVLFYTYKEKAITFNQMAKLFENRLTLLKISWKSNCSHMATPGTIGTFG